MKSGDVIGHETMGEVVEVGSENTKLKKGDRVVIPFTISCGECTFCRNSYFSGCERQRGPRESSHAPGQLAGRAIRLFPFARRLCRRTPGLEDLRVPYADVGPLKVPQGLTDEQVLFLSDIFPTGYMGAEFCDIKGGETIAVWGCGPVGQFAIKSAFPPGASG